MTSFRDRYGGWALVAGASEGLGASFAECLAERGVDLVLIARRESLLEDLADRLRERYGVEVRPLAMDLASPGLADALAAATEDLDLGVLVYNAAFVPVGRFVEADVDALERAVDVNVRAPVVMLHTLLPGLERRGRGAVILMSSLVGLQGTPRVAAYAATKAFNTVLGEGLWQELRESGIDVVACCAGAIPTPGYERSGKGRVPGMLDPDAVARRTLDALGKGPRFVPGLVNRLVAVLLTRLLPRKAAIRLMAGNTGDIG
ncbi:MAG: SDR family NAD(P)-dependent oxidoreductase [Holophagales bacterium]|nr:SDR family NAD(P)-dependent oxidoreductase [Holophagales bacterium]MYF95481.1 SDR family NAD(P)-dependent oxidoreductase [Holophagales bacterium]